MGNKVVDLATWKQCKNVEEDYLSFLTYINKYLKPPTSMPDLIRTFYFTLRYLEGTVNALDILSLIKNLPEDQVETLKSHVINMLDEIKTSLTKF